MGRLIEERSALFLHIPKTGGNWVRWVLNHLKITHRETQKLIPSSESHALPSHLAERWEYSFAFVRHPLSWYESYWKFQAGTWEVFEQGRWHPHRCIDDCASDDFTTFVENCLHKQPGYVSRMYEWYLGPPGATQVDFVGRTERIQADMVTLLAELGYEILLEEIQKVPAANVSEAKCGEPVWNAALRQAVLAVERPAIERFYSTEK